MWIIGQYLWDKQTQTPIQYQGIIMSIESPSGRAEFHYKDVNGHEVMEYFDHYQWWKDRFHEIYDREKNILL